MKDLFENLHFLLEMIEKEQTLFLEFMLVLETEFDALAQAKLAELAPIICRKEQLTLRFKSMESKRLNIFHKLCLLLGADPREHVVSLPIFLKKLELYQSSVSSLLDESTNEKLEFFRSALIKNSQSYSQLYNQAKNKIELNKTVLIKLKRNLAGSIGFMSQFNPDFKGYSKLGGKIQDQLIPSALSIKA